MCFREPLVEIIDDSGKYLYGSVDVKRVDEIIEKHIKNLSPIPEYIIESEKYKSEDAGFFDGQVKIALRNCGHMDPESID